MNLQRHIYRRLELLEKRFTSEPIVLFMPDGSAEMLRGRGDYLLDLFVRACHGERTPELELIAQSVSSAEPGGGQMIELTRDALNRPKDDEATEVDEGDFQF
jgi:hypothetical protein